MYYYYMFAKTPSGTISLWTMGNQITYVRQRLEHWFYASLSYFVTPSIADSGLTDETEKRAPKRTKVSRVRPNYFVAVQISDPDIHRCIKMTTLLLLNPNPFSIILGYPRLPHFPCFSLARGSGQLGRKLPRDQTRPDVYFLSSHHPHGFPPKG